MNFPETQSLARQLLDHFNLPHWHFGWNRRKRSLGLCRYNERRIELSAHFVLANDESQIRETILHEIAHALAGQKAGHGPAWKKMCLFVGCKPIACDKGEAIMPAGRWRATCPGCQKPFHRHKRPPKNARYWCRTCGPEKGPIHFYITIPSLQPTH